MAVGGGSELRPFFGEAGKEEEGEGEEEEEEEEEEEVEEKNPRFFAPSLLYYALVLNILHFGCSAVGAFLGGFGRLRVISAMVCRAVFCDLILYPRCCPSDARGKSSSCQN